MDDCPEHHPDRKHGDSEECVQMALVDKRVAHKTHCQVDRLVDRLLRHPRRRRGRTESNRAVDSHRKRTDDQRMQ
jgi:hypothetical protein